MFKLFVLDIGLPAGSIWNNSKVKQTFFFTLKKLLLFYVFSKTIGFHRNQKFYQQNDT